MLASTWQETEYHIDMCCATYGAHIEIYWAHEKLYEIQCLEMCRFLQYTLWLKIHVSYYCHFKAGHLYLSFT